MSDNILCSKCGGKINNLINGICVKCIDGFNSNTKEWHVNRFEKACNEYIEIEIKRLEGGLKLLQEQRAKPSESKISKIYERLTPLKIMLKLRMEKKVTSDV